MESYQFDLLGFFHFGFAILSMFLGALIIFMRKGTFVHKVIGYFYVLCMIGLNVTALMIYKLFGYFGPFHVFALISLGSIFGGFIPAYLKKPKDTWLEYHYFGEWLGFWILVGVATALTVAIGGYFIKKKKGYFIDKFSSRVIKKEN